MNPSTYGTEGNRGWRLPVATAALVAAFTFVYRLATLDSSLAGFTNDNFLHFARGQQMLFGELPVRDFAEVGMPLTEAVTAAGQAVLGRTLWSEFLVTAGFLSLATGLLFLLAARASGSTAIALVVALVHVAMEPRFYNYPKMLTYAAAIPLLWLYVDAPTRRRAAAVGAAIAVAFLFRHDHGIYVAVAAAVALAAASWPRARAAARNALPMAAAALAVLAPYLLFVQAHGGVADYARTFAAFAAYETARSPRPPQRFEVDLSAPLAQVRRQAPPLVSVRWADGLPAEERIARERVHGLAPADDAAPDGGTYVVADWSSRRLEALVRDPAVADTHGIDRERFVVNDPDFAPLGEGWLGAAARTEILPGILRRENAVPFLFYVFMAIPLGALAALLIAPRSALDARWPNARAKMIVVAVLGVLVDAGFLRGSLAGRLADVTVPVGVAAAWLVGVALQSSRGAGRGLAFGAALAVAVLVAASVNAIERTAARFRSSGLISGPAVLGERLASSYARLAATPPVAAWGPEAQGAPRVARYLHDCTLPEDRVLVLAYAPELYVLAARGFAGGHPALMPGFWTAAADQRETIARIASARVPIVLTVTEPAYTEDYARPFPLIDAYLREHYEVVASADLPYRVLVRRGVEPDGVHPLLNLPCYHGASHAHA